MTNLHRGEIACLIGGRPLRLCLTLGALAEIEAAFGCDGLAALGERLSSGRMRASDLIAIIGAAARGAGEKISDEELRATPAASSLQDFVEAATRVLQLAFAPEEAAARPPQPQA